MNGKKDSLGSTRDGGKSETQFSFTVDSLVQELKSGSLLKKNITEVSLHDVALSKDKKRLMDLLSLVQKNCPDLFLSVLIDPSIVDRNLVNKLLDVYCSIDIPLCGVEKNGVLLFDKKFHSGRAALLNEAGIVFGYEMDFGLSKGDTFKAFRERLDFAVNQYPNHIDFLQFEMQKDPPSTGVYSSKDLDFSHGMAFACRTFYTCGRAVPWFNSLLKVLRVTPSTFFADFEEWQQCNNCSLETGFVPEDAEHKEIERMQLLFIQQKLEEKNKAHLFPALEDLVRLNGAFSRVACEGEECVVETSYNPDDILSPYSMDISSFVENVTMEACQVKVFAAEDSPDYKIL